MALQDFVEGLIICGGGSRNQDEMVLMILLFYNVRRWNAVLWNYASTTDVFSALAREPMGTIECVLRS